METAVKQKKDWKKYDQERPKVIIRMQRADKLALDATLAKRGQDASAVFMEHVRPLIAQGTPEGQRAYEIINSTVQQSIAWNTGNPNDRGDLVSDDETFHGLTVKKRKTKSGDEFTFHTVKQREGQRRSDAVISYADSLLGVWAVLKTNERESLLREISDPNQHRFGIGYIEFRQWAQFAEAYEMGLHYDMYQKPRIASPQNEEESRFIQWAMDYLSAKWDAYTTGDVITLREANNDGLKMSIEFAHYQIRTDAENIETWAGIWLNEYRSMEVGPIERFETITGEILNEWGIKVNRKTIKK